MYIPTLSRPETLAIIGLIQPVGAIFPVAEMQARVFCEYVQRGERRQLPRKEKMYEDIQAKRNWMKQALVESNRHTIQVQYIPFMYELAGMIDVQPPPAWKCFLAGDPKLAWALTMGPCLSYEFRLRGPHSWEGARDAILGVWQRVTKTRKAPSHIRGDGRSHGFNCVMKEYKWSIVGAFVVLAALVMAVIFAF